MLIASDRRRALITEHGTPREPQLEALVAALDLDAIDMVLVEGFRHVPFPKIELQRTSLGQPPLYREDRSIVAVASDAPLDCAGLPLLDINRAAQIADFIMEWAALDTPVRPGNNPGHA